MLYESLIKRPKEWGLNINFKKNGITHVRPSKKNNIRKLLVPIIATKATEFDLELQKIKIPIKRCYAHLGIRMSEKLHLQDHFKYLKNKIIRKTTLDLEMNQNLWQITARSLLDYTQTSAAYITKQDREKLNGLY